MAADREAHNKILAIYCYNLRVMADWNKRYFKSKDVEITHNKSLPCLPN